MTSTVYAYSRWTIRGNTFGRRGGAQWSMLSSRRGAARCAARPRPRVAA
jgi:hypothetical protein